MIIYISNEGRLANKLWMAVKLLAVKLEHGATILYPSFDIYSEYFEGTKENGLLLCDTKAISKSYILLPKLINSACKIYCHTQSYKNATSRIVFIDTLCHSDHKGIAIINGWLKLVDNTPMTKFREDILRFFKPIEKYYSKSKAIVDKARNNNDIVIGLHIRRTDYSEWENGLYCYDDEHYLHYLDQALTLFHNKHVCFLICSDEAININNYAVYNHVQATNHFIEDIYALSLCDYIIGPPSTYSSWASFYGEVPLYHIGTNKINISVSDFAVVSC
jgi:glycosyl transferase family 11